LAQFHHLDHGVVHSIALFEPSAESSQACPAHMVGHHTVATGRAIHGIKCSRVPYSQAICAANCFNKSNDLPKPTVGTRPWQPFPKPRRGFERRSDSTIRKNQAIHDPALELRMYRSARIKCPPGISTRWISLSTRPGSETSDSMHSQNTPENFRFAKGNVSARPNTKSAPGLVLYPVE
jgi:hypothetical protein